MGEFASKGVAGSGLGLGIAGTALGLLNSNNCCNGGGLLSNLFGGGNCCNQYESKESAVLRERLAKLEAERYADGIGINTYKEAIALSNKNDEKMQANMKEAFQAIAELDKREAVNRTEIKCLYSTLDTKIDNVNTQLLSEIKCLATNTNSRIHALKEETAQAIALEAERRTCGDISLKEYVDGHFMPGTLKLPITSVCPLPAPACTVTDSTSDTTTTG